MQDRPHHTYKQRPCTKMSEVAWMDRAIKSSRDAGHLETTTSSTLPSGSCERKTSKLNLQNGECSFGNSNDKGEARDIFKHERYPSVMVDDLLESRFAVSRTPTVLVVPRWASNDPRSLNVLDHF